MLPPVQAKGFDNISAHEKRTCDVVIVGAGAGGAATAHVLAQKGYSVIILETGPKQSRFKSNYAHTAKYHMQEGGAMVAQGTAMMPIAAGKGVGGSTLINSALSFVPPDDILDNWATKLQDDDWSAKSMKDTFDFVTSYLGVAKTSPTIAGENNNLILRGLEKLGYDGGLAPRSTPRCVGCGICYYGCPSGGKNSMNLNFLPQAVERNTEIQAEIFVDQILVENNTAVGISGVGVDPDTGKTGNRLTISAKAVVLSAGAIGTPRLLWTTGLGDGLGSAVGEGLHVHPGSTLLGIHESKIEMWKGATQGVYYHPPNLPGVLPHTFSAPPEACLVAGGFVGSRFQEGMRLLPYMCGMLVMVSDKGKGRVRAKSNGRADIEYHFDEKDIQRIKDGLVSVAEVLLAGGAFDLRAPIHGVGVVNDPLQLQNILKNIDITDFTLYAAHPMATCRMGLQPQNSVVNSRGEAHLCKNLYIADASVFPTSLGVNPQITTMAVARKIADGISI